MLLKKKKKKKMTPAKTKADLSRFLFQKRLVSKTFFSMRFDRNKMEGNGRRFQSNDPTCRQAISIPKNGP